MKRLSFLVAIVLLGSLSLLAQLPDSSAFSVSPGDVTEAKVVPDPAGGRFLRVTLTPAKRAALAAFTENNLNRQIKIVVNGRLRSQPYVREPIIDGVLVFPVDSPADAAATAKALLSPATTAEPAEKRTGSKAQPPASGKPPLTTSAAADRNAFKELEGTWGVLNGTMNGELVPDPKLNLTTWTFQGSTLVMTNGERQTARFALSMEAGAPGLLRLEPIPPSEEHGGWVLFKREKDQLTLAFGDNLEGRPENFTPAPKKIILKLGRLDRAGTPTPGRF